ncbi:hypothetical protein JCM10212_000783 [Sporobolomyces blumeae]
MAAAPAFDRNAVAASLRSAFTLEAEAANRSGPASSNPRVYKPPATTTTSSTSATSQASAAAGGAWGASNPWTQPKSGAMADGKDFVRTLAASLDKIKTSSNSLPAASTETTTSTSSSGPAKK